MKVRFLRNKKGKVDRNYVIAEDGSYIRDKRTGEKLKISINGRGYRDISIKINEEYYHHINTSHLQWLAWRGRIPKGFVIHHKDENRLNDHIDNLECMENGHHHSFHNSGKKNWMYGRVGSKCPSFGIVRSYDTRNKMSISKKGKNHPTYGKSTSEISWSKFSDLQVKEIRILYFKHKVSVKELVKKFTASKSCLHRIISGKTYNSNELTIEEMEEKYGS